MSEIKTEVYKQLPAQFTMTGKFLGYPLKITEEVITKGLANRLLAYALGRLDDCGMVKCVEGWGVTVATSDAHEKPADRWYSVSFKNDKGGEISVVGILTKHGHPFIDHGLTIDG